ncbi:MAG: 2-polyprenyl-3-methyl-5-hydroxy-6-metoxy-1,4-benzoquinol methylase [Bacteroidia bacterium]|jgi:2-polyprenyl-3-methyl-5-hydroxy-6-metoxy-1,4-benzoquinol methylase
MNGEYYKTKETVDEYIKLSKGVNGSDLIERLKQIVKPNAQILELGSGPGEDWELLSKTYTVTGSDNSQEFLDRLILKYPIGGFQLIDAVTLQTDKTFDGIYANKVMHHLNDAELSDSIKRQIEILNPNGIICHSFWKGEGSEVFKGLFVNYHDKATIELFYAPHFEILTLETYKEFDADDSLLLIARKK